MHKPEFVTALHDISQWYPLQGEAGDYFYIIKAGEAVVYEESEEGSKKVNHLFKADYFGEQALLTSAPRCAHAQRRSLLC